MLTKVLSSKQARDQWGDMINAVIGGENVIVARYGKPTAVVIPYQDFAAIEEILEDLRDAREAQVALEEWRRDPTTARPWKEIKAEFTTDDPL